jgi:hypothetical protein
VDGFAARKQTLLARLHAAEAAEQLAHDERQLRDQAAAIDDAVGASREAAALVAARDPDVERQATLG